MQDRPLLLVIEPITVEFRRAANQRVARPSPLASEFNDVPLFIEYLAGRGHPAAVSLADDEIASLGLLQDLLRIRRPCPMTQSRRQQLPFRRHRLPLEFMADGILDSTCG